MNITVDASNWTADSGGITVDVGPLPVIPSLAASDFAARMLRLYPRGWLSDAAQAPGGVGYATFLGIGTPLAKILAQVQFIANGLRIKSAYGTALDVISQDYFGPNLPRYPGETDASFRARILAQLLVSRVTRAAIAAAIAKATGVTPRMQEPWSPADTASYDLTSYFGVDATGSAITGSARYGDPLAYYGFIDIASPVTTASGGFPVYAVDIGAAFDVSTSAYDLAGSLSNTQLEPNFVSQVASVVQAYKAMGITVGVRFTASGAIAPNMTSVAASTAASPFIAQSNPALLFPMQSWLQSFGVWLEILPWQASVYCTQKGVNWKFTATADAVASGIVGWYASIFATAQSPALRVGINAGQTNVSVIVAPPAGMVPILSMDYDAVAYLTSVGPAGLQVALTAGGPGNLDIAFLPGYSASVPADSASITVTSAAIPAGYSLFAVPSWATTMQATKSAGSFVLTFATAPSAIGTVYWAVLLNGAP